jgi:hypothetical protein
MHRSWFDALVDRVDRLPGPGWLFVVVATVLVAVPLHLAELVEGRPLELHPDLLIGAATLPLFLWLTLALNRVAVRALERLRPALDPAGPPEAAIAADLGRTPNILALPALAIGAVGGVSSVLQSPQNWSVDLAHPGLRLYSAIVLSVITDIFLLGLLGHVLHQLRVVMRVHRTVRIDLFHLEPLYAFSTLTAWTAIALLGLIVGLIAFLSLSIGTFLLSGAADIALTATISIVVVACFFVPLLGLHGRIADVKAARYADAQATTGSVIAAVRDKVAAGELEAAAKLKDALLAADASVVAILRISTWPWRSETLRGFVSAVLLPIGLFITYELLRRALG